MFMSTPQTDTANSTPNQLFLNRELSWLEFNKRVLTMAADERTPLLERVGFLGIFTSNLDEFIMKRVGGLSRQIAAGVVQRSYDGLTATSQLPAIRQAVIPQLIEQARIFEENVRPALKEENVHLLDWHELTAEERAASEQYFMKSVFPILTPLAVDPGHPFPHLSNLSKSLAVALRHTGEEDTLFARVKIPVVIPQWIDFSPEEDESQFRFVRLIDIITNNIQTLFVDMEVVGVMPFRISRNADIDREEEDAEDLLEMIEEELRARRFANIVRLEHGPNPDPWLLNFLVTELKLPGRDIYELPAEFDYTDLKPVTEIPRPELKYPAWTPITPPVFADEDADVFEVIRKNDVLVHHPYESFATSVQRFITAASEDPNVLAIKMTLYRTGDDSPFIPLLIRAAEAGKQVVCVVELKARFDEQRNVQVAHQLESAGVHVVYGMVGLKTHTKTALVVRREGASVNCYVHIGTGNYHAGTARFYTDLGIFTTKDAFTEDVVDLYHFLTGRSLNRSYRKLLIAPVNMRARFLEMIEREVACAMEGRPARIIAKMNQLQDREIIRALYEASNAGVQTDLIIRGFCCLIPGVEGLSENIRVRSIIGRFLEHSRVFYFRNGAEDPVDGEYFMGSADWMYRNLENRVEAITPVEDPMARERIWNMLDVQLRDNRQSWLMNSDGSYTQLMPADGADVVATHETLMKAAVESRSRDRDAIRGRFVPHPSQQSDGEY